MCLNENITFLLSDFLELNTCLGGAAGQYLNNTGGEMPFFPT